jgi:hypothetical protein
MVCELAVLPFKWKVMKANQIRFLPLVGTKTLDLDTQRGKINSFCPCTDPLLLAIPRGVGDNASLSSSKQFLSRTAIDLSFKETESKHCYGKR